MSSFYVHIRVIILPFPEIIFNNIYKELQKANLTDNMQNTQLNWNSDKQEFFLYKYVPNITRNIFTLKKRKVFIVHQKSKLNWCLAFLFAKFSNIRARSLPCSPHSPSVLPGSGTERSTFYSVLNFCSEATSMIFFPNPTANFHCVL